MFSWVNVYSREKAMENIIIFGIVAVTIFLFMAIFWKAILKLLINSFVGLALLLILDLVFCLDIPISNVYIVLAVAIFGLPAVGTLLLLRLGGLI